MRTTAERVKEIMSLTEKLKTMQELIDKLNEASKAYYGGEQEIMSNAEWDSYFDELSSLEEETGTVLPNSPTHNVSYDPNEAGEKEPHEYPALSLDKTKSVSELKKWAGSQKIHLSWKLDGLTLVLTYDGGRLVKILTRGNGHIGRNITHLRSAIAGIPKKIGNMGHVVVRGEATISYPDFYAVNEALPEGVDPYANPRNLASGTLNLDDLDEVNARRVQFTAFTLVAAPNIEGKNFNSWENRMNWLAEEGFSVVQHESGYANDLDAMIERWTNNVQNGQMQTPVDGMVLVYDDMEYANSFTVTGHHDNGAGLAFKWEDKTETTTLDHIEWSCGATCITPVAVFAPVALEGTTVTRASMHNISEARRLGIGENGKTLLEVYKANMIIPQIKSANAQGSKPFIIPDVCPVCGAPTEIKTRAPKAGANAVETLHCTNPDCAAKHLKKFARFVSRDGFDIDGLSENKLSDLILGGYISSYESLISLPKMVHDKNLTNKNGALLSERAGWGASSVKNLINAIEKSKDIDMEHFLYSLSIPMCGHHVSKLLLETWSPDEIIDMVNHDLEDMCLKMQSIDGIGPVKADAFYCWFQDAENLNVFNGLISAVNIKKEEKKAEEATCAGLTFVITGSVYNFENRDAFKKYVEAHGGKVSGSVSKKTDFLVSNEASTSSKSVKAAQLGVPVITEDEFISRF